MKNLMKISAMLTVIMFFVSTVGVSFAGTKPHHHKKSTTEKVVTAVAVGAIAGLALYAATRDHNHRDHRHYNRGYRSHRQHRPAVFAEIGYQNYSVGNPHYRNHRGNRGYWYSNRGMRFYRMPYRYNHRYDRAFNAGWERGYWAGYLQGRHDVMNGFRFHGRYSWQQRSLWGYAPNHGQYRQYERAFHKSYSVGYRHGFYRQNYGHEGFGFRMNVRY